jgi:3',5'-nucleoside bisphosphate phosphatase
LPQDKGRHLNTFKAELHIHTVLSPCAAVEMIPPLIIRTALEKGINLIAITDHNCTDNISAIIEAARDTGIAVLPGMELQTKEEIHSICLFDTLEQAMGFQELVSSSLPNLTNNAELFGEQFVVDASGDFLRREDRLLLASSSLSLTDAWNKVNDLGGMLIPAHVERTIFGLLPVLGFVPQDIPLEALEISKRMTSVQACQQYPQLNNYPLIQNGDAHQLEEMLGLTTFQMEKPSIFEIRNSLRNAEGRSFLLNS